MDEFCTTLHREAFRTAIVSFYALASIAHTAHLLAFETQKAIEIDEAVHYICPAYIPALDRLEPDGAPSEPSGKAGSPTTSTTFVGETPAGAASTPGGSATTTPLTTLAPGLPTISVNGMTSAEPTLVGFSQDAQNVVRNITWTNWGGDVATGRGTAIVEGCVPGCANGTQTPTPTTLTATNLRDGRYHTIAEVEGGGDASIFLLPYEGGATASGVSSQTSGIDFILSEYFSGINQKDYQTAYLALGPKEKVDFSEAQFATNESSTVDSSVALNGISSMPNGDATADVSFTSNQASAQGPEGDTCDHWSLQYSMTEAAGAWAINGTSAVDGASYTAC